MKSNTYSQIDDLLASLTNGNSARNTLITAARQLVATLSTLDGDHVEAPVKATSPSQSKDYAGAEFLDSGWYKVGAGDYRHDSGAKIARVGTGQWMAWQADGAPYRGAGRLSSRNAASWACSGALRWPPKAEKAEKPAKSKAKPTVIKNGRRSASPAPLPGETAAQYYARIG